MSREDGGPAFPTDRGEFCAAHEGMTLRDYFAAKAIQGFAADPNTCAEPERVATYAYVWADAMLAARKENTR